MNNVVLSYLGLALLGASVIAPETQAQFFDPGQWPCPKLGWMTPGRGRNGPGSPRHPHVPTSFSYTTIDYPLGAPPVPTGAFGIDGDLVVGFYLDANSREHGFVYSISAQTWTTLDDPLAAYFSANNDIDRNNIVGTYEDSQCSFNSFLYNGTTWTTLSAPQAAPGFPAGVPGGTWAWGIKGDQIAGYYVDVNGVTHGFVYNIQDQRWTTFDAPKAGTAPGQGTFGEGLLGDSLVGYYVDSDGVDHGFIYDGCGWTTYDAPEAAAGPGQGTWFGGVSGSAIVGGYYDSNSLDHGFLLEGGILMPLDDPAAGTGPGQGISPSTGDGFAVVGYYIDDNGIVNGFLAVPSSP